MRSGIFWKLLGQENLDLLNGAEAVVLEDGGMLSTATKSGYFDKSALKSIR